jgi:uncharacterized protein YggU (UPF0235/DUF167 family)
MSGPAWRTTATGVAIQCRLTPKGGRDAIDGLVELSDGQWVLTARVREPPEDGKANAALRTLVAERLGVPVSRVKLTGGAKSRVKQLAVEGEAAGLIARLEALA